MKRVFNGFNNPKPILIIAILLAVVSFPQQQHNIRNYKEKNIHKFIHILELAAISQNCI
ncbi:MAG: hypothetical protein JSR12_04175 [Bacteroidetes bacterium]|nr:hypothetical protein [Bacteroidota bacterium]